MHGYIKYNELTVETLREVADYMAAHVHLAIYVVDNRGDILIVPAPWLDEPNSDIGKKKEE